MNSTCYLKIFYFTDSTEINNKIMNKIKILK